MESTGEVFSPLVTYFYFINSVMGSGFLGIPWAFQISGSLLTLILLWFFTLIAYTQACYLVEAMSRAEVIQRKTDEGHPPAIPKLREVLSWNDPRKQPILLNLEDGSPNQFEGWYQPKITSNKLELMSMQTLVMGKSALYVYIVFFVLVQWGTLWGYSTIFAVSLATIIPIAGPTWNIYNDGGTLGNSWWVDYWIFLVIYSVIVIAIVIIGLKEQKVYQVWMSGMRFVIIALVVISALAAADEFSPSVANPSRLGQTLPVVAFANGFHVCIPAITQFLIDKERNLLKVIRWVFITLVVIYSVLGLVVSTTQRDLPALCTLAWQGYGGDTWWGYLISYIVLLFPALDALSCFPLQGLVTSENLISLQYSHLSISQLEALPFRTKLFYKLIVCIPPIIIAFFAFSLGLAQDWSGLFVYYVDFLNLMLLWLYTVHRVPQQSPYSGWWSRKWLLLGIFWFMWALLCANTGFIGYITASS